MSDQKGWHERLADRVYKAVTGKEAGAVGSDFESPDDREPSVKIAGETLTVSSLAEKSMEEVRKIADPLTRDQQQALFKAYRAAQNSNKSEKALEDFQALLGDDSNEEEEDPYKNDPSADSRFN